MFVLVKVEYFLYEQGYGEPDSCGATPFSHFLNLTYYFLLSSTSFPGTNTLAYYLRASVTKHEFYNIGTWHLSESQNVSFFEPKNLTESEI